MLDKTLEYVEIIMRRRGNRKLRSIDLPEGFRIVMYKEGDEKDWADIESSVGEFDSSDKALEYFKGKYLPYQDELKRRCIFIKDRKGKKIATFTAWWEYVGNRRRPWVSWVAVKPEYQGLGIGKALVSEGTKLFTEIEGKEDIFLKTQTWSYKAINIYRKNGFRMQKRISDESWGILDIRKARNVLKGKLR